LVGLILIVRGSLLGHRQTAPWSLGALAVIAVATQAVVPFAVWQWGQQIVLLFGPAEFASLIVLILIVAIALARRSHARAAGMALLGLLLSMVGIDVSTGDTRLTMGLAHLLDGIHLPVVALGLFAVADSVIGLASPKLLLRTYARQVAGWTCPRVPTFAGIALRAGAVLAIAAACYFAFELSASIFDIGVLAAFGVFGAACKLLGWNRLVLTLSFSYGPLLEENIGWALTLSRGDPAIFVRSPLSGTFLVLTCAALTALVVLSVRRTLLPSRGPA